MEENKKSHAISISSNSISSEDPIAFSTRIGSILGSTKMIDVDWNTPISRSLHLFGGESVEKQLELQKQINTLQEKIRKIYTDSDKKTSIQVEEINKLKALNEELESKEKMKHILTRLCEEGRQKILSDDKFKLKFEHAEKHDSVVMSIDIRRSTELMLKARSPELYSEFITKLSKKLSEIVLENFGVFDKFTGDGILAFFPKFYSGENAILRSLKAANECHKAFKIHYHDSKHCFNVFINNVGLGIGIDFGTVTIVNTSSELTVVGIPVVYACRFGNANAGDTLLNLPAMEEISRISADFIKIYESEIEIKNEGTALAYKVDVHEKAFVFKKPDWVEQTVKQEPAKAKPAKMAKAQTKKG